MIDGPTNLWMFPGRHESPDGESDWTLAVNVEILDLVRPAGRLALPQPRPRPALQAQDL